MSANDEQPDPLHPVRKFKGNAISMTGRVAGQQVESALERDFLTLVRFDRTVERFLTQAVGIDYENPAGEPRSYTPDCWILYRQAATPANNRPPLLCEIKYERELQEEKEVLAPKFAAARAYCEARGWRFDVFSEKQIRTPFLENARFLLPYQNRKLPIDQLTYARNWFKDIGAGTPEAFLSSVDDCDKLFALAALWHLVAIGTLGCDLTKEKISNRVPLWYVESEA